MNSTTNKVGWVFQAIEAVTITDLFYSALTVTNPPVYKISLQGVDTAGLPDGTVLGGGSPASATFTPSATSAFVTLTNSYAATRGQWLAIVMEYSSGTCDATHTCTIRYALGTMGTIGFFDVGLVNTGSWAKSAAGAGHWGYRTALATYGTPIGAVTLQTASTTLEVGIKFKLDAGYGDTFQCLGARWKGGMWTTGSVVWLTLYSGVTVLQQIGVVMDMAAAVNASTHTIQRLIFDETTLSTLNFGDFYYLGICGSASRTSALNTFAVPVASDMSAFTLGTNLHYASRTLGTAVDTVTGPVSADTAWTDTTTARPFMWPILADWTEPAGGGTAITINSRSTAHLRR
jgi:hypothetical protein